MTEQARPAPLRRSIISLTDMRSYIRDGEEGSRFLELSIGTSVNVVIATRGEGQLRNYHELGTLRLPHAMRVFLSGWQGGVDVRFVVGSAEQAAKRREIFAEEEARVAGRGDSSRKQELSAEYDALIASASQQVAGTTPAILQRMEALGIDPTSVLAVRFEAGLSINGDDLALLREPEL